MTTWSNAGDFRHTATLQQPTVTAPDAYGEIVDTWLTVAYPRMRIVDINGREAFRAHQVKPYATHVLRMRYYAGIAVDSSFRVLLNGDTLYVESAQDIEGRHRELQLTCTRRDAPADASVTKDYTGIEARVVAQLLATSAVSAMIGNRVRPVKLHWSDCLPAVVYFSNRNPANNLSGPSGTEQASIALTCQGQDYATARALAKAIKASLAVAVGSWPAVSGAPTLSSCMLDDSADNDVDMEPSQDSGVFSINQTWNLWYR
jgi:SPP1 family predicted phage head-tail adaptor